MAPRDREYKPLLFTTTVRNPRRIKALLYVLRQFDGQVLTDSLATQIVGETIRYGLYRPMKKTEQIKEKWRNIPQGEFGRTLLTDREVAYMIKHNPQNHKEAGFEWGFPSRFATIFDFAKELGLVYFAPGDVIEFSVIGRMMSEVYSVEVSDDGQIFVDEEHPEYEKMVFLHAMAKSQRKNPFVRVLNNNIPLVLLLQTIKKLNADPDFNGCGIARHELPLLIFWKDNDAEALYQRIKELRRQYRYSPSDEVIVDICVEEIMEGNFKEFKPKSIVDEYPDEFIRKMRATGLVSLRGAGRFIDINHNEDEKVEYVLAHYSEYTSYADATEREYFEYMAEVDQGLLEIRSVEVTASQSEALLNNWVSQYNWEQIKHELHILSKKDLSKDNVLKFLPAPVRLEFLTALAIKSRLPDVRVIPNYACDDTGLPTSTAGGNAGDIECFEAINGILVEVTMAEGRTQTVMEVWPINRHLDSFIETYNLPSQCVFIAPSIYTDSIWQINYVNDKDGKAIRPYKIDEFVTYLESKSRLFETI